MKFEKPFHIKLQPEYYINEPSDFGDVSTMNETAKDLGGIPLIVGLDTELNHDYNLYKSGGRMNWNLYNEPDTDKPEINVQLMRIWALQMVTQMINEKAYVNEIDSRPVFNIKEEDKNVFLNVVVEMTKTLHAELEKSSESMVLKKRSKFKLTE